MFVGDSVSVYACDRRTNVNVRGVFAISEKILLRDCITTWYVYNEYLDVHVCRCTQTYTDTHRRAHARTHACRSGDE